MIFVGIDPGTMNLGFAVIKVNKEFDNIILLSSGFLEFDKKKTLPEKLLFTYDTFFQYINKYKLEDEEIIISIEKQYIDKNPHSSFCLISSRTIFMLISQQLSIDYIEMEPSIIKKMITGNGQASKQEIISTINFYFENISLDSFDEADAIACALSAALSFKEKNVSFF